MRHWIPIALSLNITFSKLISYFLEIKTAECYKLQILLFSAVIGVVYTMIHIPYALMYIYLMLQSIAT